MMEVLITPMAHMNENQDIYTTVTSKYTPPFVLEATRSYIN
jgi:hypothetical protein